MDKNDFDKLIIGEDKKGRLTYLNDDARNTHVCILGASGTGKSTVAISLLLQKFFMDETVITLNWRRCLAVESIMPELCAPYLDNRVCVNIAKDKLKLPLCDRLKNLDGEKESDTSVKHRLSSMLTVAGGLTPTQSAVVNRAVDVIYDERLFQKDGIRSVKEYLEAQGYKTALNAAGRLRALCDENYVQDGDFLQNRDKKILEIDLNNIQYDDQIVIAKFFLDYLLRRANQGDFVKNNITVFIDECQNLDFRPGNTMSTLLSESRKLGVTLILAAPKILSGTSGMSVVQQSGTVLYFAPEPGDRKRIAKQINPQKEEEYIFHLSRLSVGEYLGCGSFMEENGKQFDISGKLSAHIPSGQKIVEKIPLESD